MKKYPALQDILLKQSSQVNVGYAHSVCNGLKSGLSLDTIQNLQAEQIDQTSDDSLSEGRNVVDLSLIKALAPKYYCPQFKQNSWITILSILPKKSNFIIITYQAIIVNYFVNFTLNIQFLNKV